MIICRVIICPVINCPSDYVSVINCRVINCRVIKCHQTLKLNCVAWNSAVVNQADYVTASEAAVHFQNCYGHTFGNEGIASGAPLQWGPGAKSCESKSRIIYCSPVVIKAVSWHRKRRTSTGAYITLIWKVKGPKDERRWDRNVASCEWWEAVSPPQLSRILGSVVSY